MPAWQCAEWVDRYCSADIHLCLHGSVQNGWTGTKGGLGGNRAMSTLWCLCSLSGEGLTDRSREEQTEGLIEKEKRQRD